MSQQEDDLRALARIMDFLRAVSIILIVANLYWFCPEVRPAEGWFTKLMAKVLNGFQSRHFMFWHERREKPEYHMADNMDIDDGWHCVVPLPKGSLADVCRHYCNWLYMSADVWCVDEPIVEEQYDG